MRIPVLTYHSMTIHGNEYSNNDHVAFGVDLRTLTSAGFEVVSLSQIVAWMYGEDPQPGNARKLVAITLDDGPDFDFRDLPHPTWGLQRSMLNIMTDFRGETGTNDQRTLHATSFVIVSPDARHVLDRTCMVGHDWWQDNWWPMAIRTGLLAIGNHSWDHNHSSLPAAEWPIESRGTFKVIDNFDAAEVQIARAASLLRAKAANAGTELFAYPYGEVNDYLVREYFPLHGARIGIRAAFTSGATPVTGNSNIWALPRYVFGHDWKAPGELLKLLRDAQTH